ncbi:MAG TPA: molybdate ABC transporter substrate-binding protein, partial [Candidatus Acidoferrum sp.]|nr:molybdate ABC transporter substrate-binding protein [Candidatus Acidoferrum sp.]
IIPIAEPTSTPTIAPTPTPTPTAIPQPVDLRIFIASSLTHVVANMTQAFDAANNCNLIVNSGSSSALYTQITSGSPCDVFMSADTKWTKQLNRASLLYNNNYVNFTTNSLEMIIAQGNPKNITSLADLAKPGVKLVLADPSIPSGSYTNTTFWKIDSTWGNASSPQYNNSGAYVNYNYTVHQNVVSYELTVENVVGKVSLNVGTADAGVVFVSDAVYGQQSGSHVQFIPIPTSVNTQGIYGIGVIGSTTQSALAQKFMDFWSSTDGQALLTYYGFDS